MSDTGKRWWKVTGVAKGLANAPNGIWYTFARTAQEAREQAGNAFFEAEPATDDEMTAYFTQFTKGATKP
jgi:hypothetical protein